MRESIVRLVSKKEGKGEKQNKKNLQDNYIQIVNLAYNNAIIEDFLMFF